MKSVQEWIAHWDAKRGIENKVELNGYCVDGIPLSREVYDSVVTQPYLDRLELSEEHAVLDIGCGAGLMLERMERFVASCVGVDPSQTMLDNYAGNAKTYCCEADQLPFEGEQFDRILMAGVALYFPDDAYFERVIKKALSLLRRPGILLIGDMLIGSQPVNSAYRFYDPGELVTLLESLQMPYTIAAQIAAKRAINNRRDIIIYKD